MLSITEKNIESNPGYGGRTGLEKRWWLWRHSAQYGQIPDRIGINRGYMAIRSTACCRFMVYDHPKNLSQPKQVAFS